jgi:hypothetical protein
MNLAPRKRADLYEPASIGNIGRTTSAGLATFLAPALNQMHLVHQALSPAPARDSRQGSILGQPATPAARLPVSVSSAWWRPYPPSPARRCRDLRLNISTVRDVRAVLDDTLPESVTRPGSELAYDRRQIPAHVSAVAAVLQDPDRGFTAGGTRVTPTRSSATAGKNPTRVCARCTRRNNRFVTTRADQRLVGLVSSGGVE